MRYINPYQRKIYPGFIHFLLWRLGYFEDTEIPEPLPKDFVFPNPYENVDVKKPMVTWVNHSTFLVRAFGKTILVDPIWNERCSPFRFVGPKRRHPAVPPLETISSPDVIFISHNHYDHLDFPTVCILQKKHPQALWVVPKGVRKWFLRRFPTLDIKELIWWESFTYDTMTITSVPAQHFSGRGLFDRNQSLWAGYVIEFTEGKRLYFAGDTGYNASDFKEIKNTFVEMDLSLLPIGVYKPRAFMRPVHVSPHESIQIHLDVGSKLSIGGHWGTFRLSSEEMERPPFDLYRALEKALVPCAEFRILNPGQSVNW